MRAKINYRRGEIEIEVSSIELKRLDNFKRDTIIYLDRLAESYGFELDVLTSIHYDTEPKKFELINLRYKLIMDEHYNKYYKDVLIVENGHVRFNNSGTKFLSFANAYAILEDETKGLWQLENILKIKILEWNIEYYNDHPENDYFVKYKTAEDYFNKDYLNVFQPYGFELFCFLNDNIEGNCTPPIKFTIIYHFMFDKTYLKNTKKNYRDFVKEHCKGQLINKSKKPYKYNKIENKTVIQVKYDNLKEELQSLFSQFETSRKLRSKVE